MTAICSGQLTPTISRRPFTGVVSLPCAACGRAHVPLPVPRIHAAATRADMRARPDEARVSVAIVRSMARRLTCERAVSAYAVPRPAPVPAVEYVPTPVVPLPGSDALFRVRGSAPTARRVADVSNGWKGGAICGATIPTIGRVPVVRHCDDCEVVMPLPLQPIPAVMTGSVNALVRYTSVAPTPLHPRELVQHVVSGQAGRRLYGQAARTRTEIHGELSMVPVRLARECVNGCATVIVGERFGMLQLAVQHLAPRCTHNGLVPVVFA